MGLGTYTAGTVNSTPPNQWIVTLPGSKETSEVTNNPHNLRMDRLRDFISRDCWVSVNILLYVCMIYKWVYLVHQLRWMKLCVWEQIQTVQMYLQDNKECKATANSLTNALTITKSLLSSSISFDAANFGFNAWHKIKQTKCSTDY